MRIFSEDAARILEQRYFLKEPDGRVIEDAAGLLRRVAKTVAAAEKDRSYWEERFFELMAARRFLPNSPTLANSGRPKGQLAACFVLPVPDSIEGIFETMKKAALIHKTGGGTGFSFSDIRPSGDMVASTGGVASGPLSFITAYNCATDAVKQGGMRRGANMAVLDCRHPDILDFVNAKKNEGVLANFNLSVGVDKEFMSEVIGNGVIDFINPRTGKGTGKKFRAAELFDSMARAAWENGEPGVLFFDHINSANSLPGCGPLKATNPCGEQPLFDYESCNLGSLNLPAYLSGQEGETRSGINWDLLGQDIHTAVRFLDDVIDVNHYVFPEVEEVTRNNRKIGLGVMGFADLLIQLGIPYASQEALSLIDELMGFIRGQALAASEQLGRERGSFPNMGKSIFKGRSMRNATLITIAPTGTLSMLADVSSGIEPLFGLVFIKEVLNGRQFTITNRWFEEAAIKGGFHSEALLDELRSKGSLRNIEGIPEEIKKVFVTAFDITPEWHIRVQAAFQKWVDNAVSKTINFPAEAGIGDIRAAYLQAWRQGCKGLTIYRTGSRLNQVLKFAAKDLGPEEDLSRCHVCTD